MQSINQYQSSLKELKKIQRQASFDQLIINMSRLDDKSKEMMIAAVRRVASERIPRVTETIEGVNK